MRHSHGDNKSFDGEVELQRLIGRTRELMGVLTESELRVMFQTAETLLKQWEKWFRLIRRGRAEGSEPEK